jgi:hypothetical protein
MGVIYCLFSTKDGVPRYIGQTRGEAPKRLKQHLANALDKDERGTVNAWIRDVLRKDHIAAVRIIQEDIAPKDLDMFETYWIGQFPNLLNSDASKRRKATATAQKITEAIQKDLRTAKRRQKDDH